MPLHSPGYVGGEQLYRLRGQCAAAGGSVVQQSGLSGGADGGTPLLVHHGGGGGAGLLLLLLLIHDGYQVPQELLAICRVVAALE